MQINHISGLVFKIIIKVAIKVVNFLKRLKF